MNRIKVRIGKELDQAKTLKIQINSIPNLETEKVYTKRKP